MLEALRPRPFWLWMNLLSLDAPLVALVWQDFLTRCYPSLLRPAGRWVLFLTVWAIYIGDRLIDVRGPATLGESTRHGFYRSHRALARAVLTIVVLGDLSITRLWLRPEVFANGLLAGTGVVCYLAVFPFWRMGGTTWKQPCAALLFTAGVFLIAWTGTANPWSILGAPAAAFGALCLGNMALIEQGRRVWIGMATLAVFCAAMCIRMPHPHWYAAVALTAATLAALDFWGSPLSRDARGVLADLVLLTPLLFR